MSIFSNPVNKRIDKQSDRPGEDITFVAEVMMVMMMMMMMMKANKEINRPTGMCMPSCQIIAYYLVRFDA